MKINETDRQCHLCMDYYQGDTIKTVRVDGKLVKWTPICPSCIEWEKSGRE